MPIPSLSTNTGNPVIGWADWSDAATLSTTAAVEGTNALTNLQTDQPTELASLNASSIATILCDHQSPAPWNHVQLLFTNLTVDALWRIRAADVEAELATAPLYDSGWLPAWMVPDMTRWRRPHASLRHPTGMASRYVQIELDDTANPDGYLRLGVLVIGQFWQTPRAQSIGRTFGFDDASTSSTAVDGRTIVTSVEPAPGQNFGVELIDPPDAEDDLMEFFYELVRERGASRPVVIMLRPDDPVHAARNLTYGLLEVSGAGQGKEDGYGAYSFTVRIRGML